MIAIDTNILVYAHRRDSVWHEEATEHVQVLAESAAPWAVPFPCLHEFLAIVTHPAIFDPPSTTEEAVAQVDAWLESPSLVLPPEPASYWGRLRDLLIAGRIQGPLVHDARVAAICLSHEVRELWTADRDFGRFPMLETRNPLTGYKAN